MGRRSRRVLQSVSLQSRPAVRSLLWLALLAAVALGASGVVSAHRSRLRGIPSDFPAPVSEADVPTLGVNVALHQYGDDELASVLSLAADGGFAWVRQPFSWSQITRDGASGSFDWSDFDRLMGALGRYPQLRPVAVLVDDPPVPPDDPEQFAAFAGAFAERYGDQIDYYQVWDEPNLAANWGGGPVSPPAYADLLARAARAIRAADPHARILLAGLAPTAETGPQNLSDVRYLERLYEADAEAWFDIVAAKPYGFDSGPYDRRVDESMLNVSRVLLLREVMIEHGDAGKAIWASHWGWNALPEGWEGASSIWGQTDEETQAAWSVGMLERAREEWPWIGAMIVETLQPLAPPAAASQRDLEDPRWGFSLLTADGTPRPVYRAIADWAYSLPAAAPVGGYPPRNQWASYEGSWRVGPLGADVVRSPESESDQARASFRFDGTRVALTVRRGPNRGFLYVTVDGKPAGRLPRDEEGRTYVVLYGEQWRTVTVPLAAGLRPGPHTVEVVADGGEGQWPLIDWRVGARPVRDRFWWKLGGLFAAAFALLVLLLRDLRRIRWDILTDGFLRLPLGNQTGLTLALTGVLWATAALSWGGLAASEILSALSFVIGLVTLPMLSFLFALRLDLGLTMVALSAPFYLVPAGMFSGALSLSEVLVLLCLAAYVGMRIARARAGSTRWLDLGGRLHPGRGSVPFVGMDSAVILFVLAALAAGLFAADRSGALFELRSVFLLPALYYGLLRLVPLDRRAQQSLVDGLLLGGVAVAVIGLGQAALGRNLVVAEGGLFRLQSVYRSPNSLGLYLGRVWPFLVVGVRWGPNPRRRALSILALLPVTLALGLSFSRGALLLALPASILVIGWWAGGRYRWVALAALAAWGLALIPLFSLSRFRALFDLGKGTTFFRLKLWRSSLQMLRDHPLFGVGPGGFLKAYRTRYVLPAAWEEFNLGHAHNVLLDHWTRLGALGVAGGLALQATFWKALGRRRRDALTLSLAGGMAALLAHGLVDNAIFAPDLALTFFLMLALAQEQGRDD